MMARKKFACKVLKTLPENLWTEGVGFYFDGVGFAHKYHPRDRAQSTKTMAWRKACECLMLTTKGKQEGTGGPNCCNSL